MKKALKSFYNFLIKLKRYHATHIMIIPSALFYFSTYSFLWLPCFIDWDFVSPDAAIFVWAALIFYCFILFISLIIAIMVTIIILIREKFTKTKILVKSKFLLENKFYNFIFLFIICQYFLAIIFAFFRHMTFIFYFISFLLFCSWINSFNSSNVNSIGI